MVISPPFLPAIKPGDTEETWLERAMDQGFSFAPRTRTPFGSYPVSGYFRWHTGLHNISPVKDHEHIPMCAIADAEVLLVRQPTLMTKDEAHPQNYSGGWTDNGCVILKHVTEIGARGQTPVVFTYFSLYMHMGDIGKTVQVGHRVYRKDVIGRAGQHNSGTGIVHLEICCDAANAEILLGRKPGWHDFEHNPVPSTNGRTDVVFGELFFYLPATTPTSISAPSTHMRDEIAVANPLHFEQWVGILYEKGHAYVRSFNQLGEPIGQTIDEAGYEYHLYKEAAFRCKSAAAATSEAASSTSAWYELLRFGRNLGGDPLPFNVAHWRQIHRSNGKIWVDLNAPGVKVFSEADFLPITGWNCYEKEKDQVDNICKNIQIKLLAMDRSDLTDDNRLSVDRLGVRLGEADVMKKMRRTVCNLPSEWDAETVMEQHRHVYDDLDAQVGKIRGEATPDYAGAFKDHCMAMALTNLPEEYKAATWHFHPAEFIATMRKCTWMSPSELAQCIPRKMYYLDDAVFNVHGGPNWATALQRMQTWSEPFNKSIRKFLINSTRLRLALFIGQLIEECGHFSLVVEGGGPGATYAPYYGRGLIQLTNKPNYVKYGAYKRFMADKSADTIFPSLHWNPNVLLAASNASFNAPNCCDSAGFYWTCPEITSTGKNALCISDAGGSISDIVECGRLTNGDNKAEIINGLPTRIQASIHACAVLMDEAFSSTQSQITFVWRLHSRGEPDLLPDGTRKMGKNGRPKTKQTATTHVINRLTDFQRP